MVSLENFFSLTTLYDTGTKSALTSFLTQYRVEGNFLGRKLFVNCAVCGYSQKFCPQNSGGVASFGAAKASNPRKFSPLKSYFSTISESFLPRKFPAIWYLLCIVQED